jgi:hypothetical protein
MNLHSHLLGEEEVVVEEVDIVVVEVGVVGEERKVTTVVQVDHLVDTKIIIVTDKLLCQVAVIRLLDTV